MLGTASSNEKNWYNFDSIFSSDGAAAWGGTSNQALPQGWFNARHNIAFLNNQNTVNFRINFVSDKSNNKYHGIGFDDFQITYRNEPKIDSVSQAPNNCNSSPTTISAFVSSPTPLANVSLMYSYSGSVLNQSISMSQIGISNQWIGTIPVTSAVGAKVIYAVRASNATGLSDTSKVLSFTANPLTINAGNDTSINYSFPVELIAKVSGFGSNKVLQASFTKSSSCQGGFMMDLTTGSKPIKINGLTIFPAESGIQTVEVFYKSGSKSGFQNNPNSWTSAGVYIINPNIVTATYMPIDPLIFQPQTPFAIYLKYNGVYSDENTSYTDSILTILTGEAMCIPFSGCCSPNTFTGSINYSTTPPINWRRINSSVILSTTDTFITTPVLTTSFIASTTDSICLKSDTVLVTVSAFPGPDIQITRLIYPQPGFNYNDSVPITLVLKNIGLLPTTNFNVAYSINMNTLQTNIISQVINSNDSLLYTFTPAWRPLVNGNYDVCVFVNNVLGDINKENDTICIGVNSAVNVKKLNDAELIAKLYPNPANSQLFVEFNQGISKGRIEVYNSIGQNVLNLPINNESETARQIIDLVDLYEGLYFLKLKTNLSEQTMRFQIIR